MAMATIMPAYNFTEEVDSTVASNI